MGRGKNTRENTGRITAGISVNTLALETISFVSQQLPAWRDDPDRPFEQSEPKLNSQLCDFLDSRAKSLFPMVYFKHEEPQSSRRSVDLSAKTVRNMGLEARLHTTIYDPILVFECKRLPTPSKVREKEYVTGAKPDRRTGGIQRFKMGLHGARLDISAMIGYVQDRSARDWYDKINEWILQLAVGTIVDGCIWKHGETLELLKEDVAEGVASYRSVHSRTGNVVSDMITLHHLWIAMN